MKQSKKTKKEKNTLNCFYPTKNGTVLKHIAQSLEHVYTCIRFNFCGFVC